MDLPHVFRVDRAHRYGLSARQVRRRRDRGTLVSVHPGVVARADHVLDRQAELVAALLWAGPTGVLSGTSAAALHGLPLLNAPVDIEVTIAASSRRSGRVRLVRSVVPPQDQVVVGGLPVTSAARTVRDCALRLPFELAVAVADGALRLGLVSVEDLDRLVADGAGQPGAMKLKRVRDAADGRAENFFESLGRMVVVGAGLPRPQLQVSLRDRSGHILRADMLIDFLVIELDGREVHGTDAAFQHDRDVSNRLQAAGYRLLRFTYSDLTRRPEYVVDCIRRALLAGAPRQAA